MTSAEGCRKIEALLFFAIFIVVESRDVEQRLLFNAGSKVEATIQDLSEHIGAMMANPSLQEKAKSFAKQFKTLAADSQLQSQMKLTARSMKAMFADPNFANRKGLEQRMEALKAHPKLREQVELMGEAVAAMMTDPELRNEAKLVGERMQAVMTGPMWQRQAELAAQRLAVVSDPMHNKVEALANNLADNLFGDALKLTGSPIPQPEGMSNGNNLRGNSIRSAGAITQSSESIVRQEEFESEQALSAWTRGIRNRGLIGTGFRVSKVQSGIMATFDRLHPAPEGAEHHWLTTFEIESMAPFWIYGAILYAARLAGAPCEHQLGILWFSTVVFTVLSINFNMLSTPQKRTPEWMSNAIWVHFLSCWLPLQVPALADQLLLPQNPDMKCCHVESFIPNALEEKRLDWSKFFSTSECVHKAPSARITN